MDNAQIWEESVVIPTYAVGEKNKNPMFLEKRVYQGSSGRVYPYPVIDKIYDECKDVAYQAVYLENAYIRIMVLPSLGGRIHSAYDKTNGYDFVYHNEVIKPALVGLLGPWISGGIEFNWPQHHRPTTFMGTDYQLLKNDDGSVTLRINDLDEMYGTKGITSFCLYPDKAYIEITGQLYNRTPYPQTFLWWANPAVAVNDDTQSVFPPDVHAVFDHGKRAVSSFPIATGVYYKHDYSEGVDISRYKNIPVPTSYMAYKSGYDFVGGYDYGKKAGLLHIADHHISPGKKQWTWGNGDFGKAWDRNLTDKNGPYIELMTGVYTDNQPDFTFLMPGEEKTFTQYFLPYKDCGYVKNANIDVVLNYEREDDEVCITVYPTHPIPGARIVLLHGDEILFSETKDLSVLKSYEKTIPCNIAQTELVLSVYDADGALILSATAETSALERLPSPARPALPPEKIQSTEELYLTGLHIEQYRHATFDSEAYYIEALKRDKGDARSNNALGLLCLRQSRFEEAESYFRRAIERLTALTPNPYDGEPLYNLGLSLLYQGRFDESYDAFYKASWCRGECEMGFFYLAAISARKGAYDKALYFVEKSLVHNGHNNRALTLKAYILRSLSRKDDAIASAHEALAHDPFDWGSKFLLLDMGKGDRASLAKEMRSRLASYLFTSSDLILAGFAPDAISLLSLAPECALAYYYKAYAAHVGGDEEKARVFLEKARKADPGFLFPNTGEDFLVLSYALAVCPEDGNAHYGLGNLCYDRKRYSEAAVHWRACTDVLPAFPTAWRNLSLALYNKMGDKDEARICLERAFALDVDDARVFLELDQLYEKLGVSPEKRKALYDAHPSLIAERDDLYVGYVTLCNVLGESEKALALLSSHHFHPWEGGEGKVTGQWVKALKLLALGKMHSALWDEAITLLSRALSYPENLGEGKLEGTKDNDIHYLLGACFHEKGDEARARAEYTLALDGLGEVSGVLYYNDQPSDMILFQSLAYAKLGDVKGARRKAHALSSYAQEHLFDEGSIDYFAVSLPDLQLWDEDIGARGRAHCHYLLGLSQLAQGCPDLAVVEFDQALGIKANNWDARMYRSIGRLILSF